MDDTEWPPRLFYEMTGPLQSNSVELFTLVGAVAVWGAELEALMLAWLAHLAPTDPGERALGLGETASWLTRECRSRLNNEVPSGTSWRVPALKAFDAADAALERRNQVVHATYWDHPLGIGIVRRPRRHLPTEVYPALAEDIGATFLALTSAWSYLLAAWNQATGNAMDAATGDAG